MAPSPPKTSSLFQSWARCNNMVLSWLLNSLSKEIAANIIYVDSAKEMWSDLHERFSQGNGPRIFQLQKSIASFAQDDLSVSAYFTQMKGLWDELMNYHHLPVCSCGGLRSLMSMHQQDYVMRFLMGLNDSYSHIRGQILLIEPLPPINKVFSLVLQEEQQRDIGLVLVPDTQSIVFSSTTKHVPMAKPSTRRPICSHCSIPRRTMEKCFELHGYPPGYRSKGRSSNSTSISHPSINSAHHNSVNTANSTLNPSMPFTPQQCQQLWAFLHPTSSDSLP
ncbi:uncharacterized protein LOC121265750 [Juglans microcarpa x Juglans regia]|uniref:uncharacterized protein LOC121265750 n=1 Tax=Juglans microcarpa x Juglans regia TaxID=2249226 RepID=UPI001B7EB59C|nr:uncharacterized protein LOC121265750 [Juglans microcarpa x Juglans regia]